MEKNSKQNPQSQSNLFQNDPEHLFFQTQRRSIHFSDYQEIQVLAEESSCYLYKEKKDEELEDYQVSLEQQPFDFDAMIDQVLLSQTKFQQPMDLNFSDPKMHTRLDLEKGDEKKSINFFFYESEEAQIEPLDEQFVPFQKNPKKSKPIKKQPKTKVVPERQRSDGKDIIRKGKHNQQNTQKFIRFMTFYHYSKNFKQYYKKKVLEQRLGSFQQFQKFSPQKKIEIIDKIILDLQNYNMAVHYTVEAGDFFDSFNSEKQSVIVNFFQQIIRKSYRVKFQTQKRRILNIRIDVGPRKAIQKFLDEMGQQQFDKIFDNLLESKQYRQDLLNCNFKERLQRVIQLK